MAQFTLFFATNRAHQGKDRWKPESYGKKFSDDGMENLRFGKVSVTADEAEIQKYMNKNLGVTGRGDGESLAGYISKCAKKNSAIIAYQEKLDPGISDKAQPAAKFGSLAMFNDLKAQMEKQTDVVVYIHGFNVSWYDAVGSAMALEMMLNSSPGRDMSQKVRVVLFTWPSDGMMLPFASYKSDRSEAIGSGGAVGRAFLKLRDYFAALRDRAKGGEPLCGQNIHLLCHSMGNFLLQNALMRMQDFSPGKNMPRIFEHVFLCAPDLDDTVLEPGQPMYAVSSIANQVTLYHNKGDVAMVISDYTKGNPDRLGKAGAARPSLLHNKVHQVDCTPIVEGITEHSYYLNGYVNADIRMSVDERAQEDAARRRDKKTNQHNVWEMK